MATALHTDSEIPAAPAAPSTREVAAAALLVAFGGVGAFLPFASAALFSGTVSHGPQGLESLMRPVVAATNVPVVAVLAGVAAFGLYRRLAWGHRLALVVATLLLLSPVAAALDPFLVPNRGGWDEATETHIDGGWVDVVLYHVFLVPSGQSAFAAFAALVGGLAAIALLTRPRADRPPLPGAAPARRPTLAMLLLLVLGVLSLAPYLAWLANLVPAASANGAPAPGDGGLDLGAGILWAVTSLGASGAGLIAARAIRSRSAIGPYVAPMASVLAGVWTAGWLGITAARALAPFDGEHGAAPNSIVAGIALAGLALIAIAAPLIVTVSVFRRRSWFRVRGATAPRRGGPRVGRFERTTGAAGAVLVAPLIIVGASWIVDPPLPQLGPSQVVFAGVVYYHVAPLELGGVPVVPAGVLDGWSRNLDIVDPAAFTLAGRSQDEAIVVRASSAVSWTHDLFVPGDGASAVLPALCAYVPLENPSVFVDPCGPPSTVELGGVSYTPVSEGDFAIGPSDLVAAGASVRPAAPADPRVDLAVMSIRNVPTSTAFALRIGPRIVIYRPVDDYGSAGSLCLYSPSAIDNPLEEGKSGGVTPPSGCGFPHGIWYGGNAYLRKDLDLLLVVPATALTPLGPAEALATDKSLDEPVREPFPPTIESTAYRITGVEPSAAIAFIVGDQVVVVASLASQLDDEEPNQVPLELCPYVRSDIAPEEVPAACPR